MSAKRGSNPAPGRDIAALAHDVGALLLARSVMCATAESCTGGLVAGALTDIAGSSAWFERGFVTYSNDAKHALLGVPMATIERHGAVSEATARAMAEGALACTPATVGVAVAVTGIAGPGGGSVDKPVGTVCFGWAVRGGATHVVTQRFEGDREAVRRASVAAALAGLAVAAATLPVAKR